MVSESSECYSFGQAPVLQRQSSVELAPSFKDVEVLIELLVGRPPAVLAQDGHSCVQPSDLTSRMDPVLSLARLSLARSFSVMSSAQKRRAASLHGMFCPRKYAL